MAGTAIFILAHGGRRKACLAKLAKNAKKTEENRRKTEKAYTTSLMAENEVATEIVDAAYHIHRALGPGLLESVYETVLAHELAKRGVLVVRQAPVQVVYDGMVMEAGFRADLVVEDLVIVEIKSVETLLAVHKKQLLTYLRLSNKKLGLLINFYEVLIKDGITRIANGL